MPATPQNNRPEFMHATIIRHLKERMAKCSLRPLRGRPELTFVKARPQWRFDATGYTLLAVGAPVLSQADAGRPLLLLDSTWRLLPQLEACLDGTPERRGLPTGLISAYPRVSKTGVDPLGGLASVEALFTAGLLMGEPDISLLSEYYWREAFLQNLRTAGVQA